MRRGFTLIETLIAVTILAIAVAGPMYAASRALVAAQNSNHQLTASLLAQEALERVRQLRDDKYLASSNSPGTAWTNFRNMISACQSPSKCPIDVFGVRTDALASCSSCTALRLDAATKRYSQSTGDVTPYTRTIQVEDVGDGAGSVVGQKITARVDWTFRGAPYFVEVKDILMPWQPQL